MTQQYPPIARYRDQLREEAVAEFPRIMSKGQSSSTLKRRAMLLVLRGMVKERSTKAPAEERHFESHVMELTAAVSKCVPRPIRLTILREMKLSSTLGGKMTQKVAGCPVALEKTVMFFFSFRMVAISAGPTLSTVSGNT